MCTQIEISDLRLPVAGVGRVGHRSDALVDVGADLVIRVVLQGPSEPLQFVELWSVHHQDDEGGQSQFVVLGLVEKQRNQNVFYLEKTYIRSVHE
ncbi:hypothetical protein AVEN_39413-1 [Araneus ventricosus]|uniref:Uncharacterized protein n=1 Tax=Araneus ventricosus TaxID=182803 RepID=A0A4Y2J234_ARAVE|nr:hypothetical protein AVEN_39413-1 [Araneus ventricosus]